jgi:hypothetical protein
MTKRIEASVASEDKKVTVEGPEDFVRQLIESLALQFVGVKTEGIAALPQASTPPHSTTASEKQLIAEKNPSGHSEIIAVLAYCLTANGQPEFSPEDIRRAYIRAGQRPPKVISQGLRDAKNIRDFIEPGAKRGHFRLSPHGERTVLFDLPKVDGK